MLPKPIWIENNDVYLIDQTKLPGEISVLQITTAKEMWDAIQRLAVRGAPAIGLAAAFGVAVGLREKMVNHSLTKDNFVASVVEIGAYLDTSRPTAVNLHHTVLHMNAYAEKLVTMEPDADLEAWIASVFAECETLLQADIAACRAIGVNGADILEQINGLSGVLTHCNAGALATSQYGTALAPFYVMQERGKAPHVYSDETRPLLQGARLTAWELSQSGIPVTTICDNMAGVVMAQNKVQAVIVGADRIAANGDTANKIGTYTVAILAKEHGIPFYVAAPVSTIDFTLKDGSGIPIEERKPDEIRFYNGKQNVPAEAEIFNPAFDVTPEKYITAIITEKGVAYPPFAENLRALREGLTPADDVAHKLKAQVLETAKRMAQDRLSNGSFGNVSAADRSAGLMAITPSGMSYETMTEKDICLLHVDGTEVEGCKNSHKPSSEWMLHSQVYQARKDCSGIVHTHSAYATACSVSGEAMAPVITEMGMIAPGSLPNTGYAAPGSTELANKTARALEHANGCLLQNHGVVTASDSLERAYRLALIVENNAQTIILAKQSGGLQEIPKEICEDLFASMQQYGR